MLLFGIFITSTYVVASVSLIKKSLAIESQQYTLRNHLSLFSDEPIGDETEDLIGRINFVSALKENIYNLTFKESFVMALHARWGEGKTSILNLLKKEIRKDGSMIIYDFDPWFFGNEDALTSSFYRGLEDLLQEHYFIPKKIKSFLKLYPEVLIKGFVGINFQFLKSKTEDRPLELKREIEHFITSVDKRILVIIDDLDRLQRDEILAVFRLIKLTSHMKNMIFLLSFDPIRVALIIKNKDLEEDLQSYIEKIVQLPIHIPMADQRIVDKFLLFSYPDIGYRSEIDKFFDQLQIGVDRRREFDDAFVKIYQSNLRQIFSTFRAAKRYLNGIRFRLPFIEREIYLYDFFIIEIFHTFFPNIYADIKSSAWSYISPWSLEVMAFSPFPHDEKQKYLAIKKHIEQIISNQENKALLVSLLEDIFPEVKNAFVAEGHGHTDYSGMEVDYRTKKRIAHPDCFFKYFMLGVREGIIPDAEFEDLLKQWIKSSSPEAEIESSLFGKYQKVFKLIDLLQRLKIYASSIHESLVLPLIRTVYHNCSKFQREGDLWNTEYSQAEGLIFRLLEDNAAVKHDQVHSILKEIVEQVECLDFASWVVLGSNESRGGGLHKIYKNVQLKELRDILSGRLRKDFVEGRKDIFDIYPRERQFAFILHQWATRWEDPKESHRDEVNDYLMNLFKTKPNRLGYFLLHFVIERIDFDKGKYFDYAGFKVAYDSNKLFSCLTELGEKAYSTESEKVAIELFIKAHKKSLKEREESSSTQQ
jgi:hypothetical protein